MTHIDSFKAIRTGLVLVIVSAIIFMLTGLLIGIICVFKFKIHFLYAFAFMTAGLIIYWPFWSFLLVKWKIWSFERIDDIEMLIEMAEKRALIYPETHFYSQNEFCSSRDKQRVKKLFEKKKAENNLESIRQAYRNKVVEIYPKYSLTRDYPLLKLTIDGIWFRELGEIAWGKFSRIEAKTSGGRYATYWIEYSFKNSKEIEKYKLNNMNIGYLRLEYFLKTFKHL